MNNQNILNSVSLKEASELISNELIKARFELEQRRKQLLADKKKYELDYVAANDGDSSENAPLEQAILNLKLVTGEIGDNARVLQIMERLEDVQYLIGTYDFSILEESMSKLNSKSIDVLFSTFGVKDIDALINLLRESNPGDLAESFMVFKNYADGLENNIIEQDCVVIILDFWNVATLPKYNTCGIVVPYSTVRLDLNGKIMTYRIYPEGVSFIDIGVIAANSRVARALIGKEKGQSINIRHDSNNTQLTYKILDIY